MKIKFNHNMLPGFFIVNRYSQSVFGISYNKKSKLMFISW